MKVSLLIILPIVCKSFQINVNGMRANVFDQVLGQIFWPRHDYFPSLVSTVYVFFDPDSEPPEYQTCGTFSTNNVLQDKTG